MDNEKPICSLWIGCLKCNLWHLKISSCLPKEFLKIAKTVQIFWSLDDIAFLDKEVTELYGVIFLCPYVWGGAEEETLNMVHKAFIAHNKSALEYINKH